MVRIRLRRTGKKKQPNYRLVVADARSPRDGKFIEIIGHYNPVSQPKVLEVKDDRARYWLSVGAQPSDPVVRLLKQRNVIDENGKVIATESTATTASAAPVASAPVAPAPVASAPVEAAPAAPVNPAATSTDAA